MGSKIRMRRLTWSARLEKAGFFRTHLVVNMSPNAHVIHSVIAVYIHSMSDEVRNVRSQKARTGMPSH
jgi:hypothetical protein